MGSGCTSLQQKYSWAKSALETDNISKKQLSSNEIGEIFAGNYLSKEHPYFTADFQLALDKKTNSSLYAGNKLTLLANKESAKMRLKLINSAQKIIHLTTFHLICDEGGEEFSAALIAAVKRKVKVRFLETGGPWSWLSGTCLLHMVEAGAEVEYAPYSFVFSKSSLLLHDKHMIVDNKIAIVGGQNIGNFFSKSDGKNGNFRDTDVAVEGPVVLSIARRFVDLWQRSKAQDHSLQAYSAALDLQEKKWQKKGLAGSASYEKWLNADAPAGLCRFVAQDPQLDTYYVFDAYTQLALAAQKHIAFHVPSLNGLGSEKQETLLAALMSLAQKNDARVDIITNGPGLVKSNIVFSPFGSLYGMYTLARVFETVKGSAINVYGYRSWLHSKVFYFDDIMVAVGSFNFDETALAWTEDTLICMDPSLVNQTTQMFKNDFAHSVKLVHQAGSKSLNSNNEHRAQANKAQASGNKDA